MSFNPRELRKSGILMTLVMLSVLTACTPSTRPAVPDTGLLEELGFTPLPDGKQIPDISFLSLDGKETVRLEDFRGSVVLLNFWASWCPPCRAEMPSMDRLNSVLKENHFVMLAVNVQEEESLIEAFLREYNLNFPIFMDPDGSAARDIGVAGLPTSILIDRKGRAVAAVTGALEWDSEAILDMMKNWTR